MRPEEDPMGERAPRGEDPERHAALAIARFFAENWPFGEPRPAVYYEPPAPAPSPASTPNAWWSTAAGHW